MKPSASPEYRREYRRKYCEANREKVRELARNYYRANKEKLCAYARERWALDPDKYNAKKKEQRSKQDQERLKALNREKSRRWRSKPENHAVSIAFCRKYKEQHKERLRQFRKENHIDAASDNYVRHLLGFKKPDHVSADLIELKREHLKLTRKLKTNE